MAKIIGRIPKDVLKARIVHTRKLKQKPLRVNLGKVLREAFRTGRATS